MEPDGFDDCVTSHVFPGKTSFDGSVSHRDQPEEALLAANIFGQNCAQSISGRPWRRHSDIYDGSNHFTAAFPEIYRGRLHVRTVWFVQQFGSALTCSYGYPQLWRLSSEALHSSCCGIWVSPCSDTCRPTETGEMCSSRRGPLTLLPRLRGMSLIFPVLIA
ncbi:hypothetical protein CC79DRAFT_452931 [Sarocladium strictum]